MDEAKLSEDAQIIEELRREWARFRAALEMIYNMPQDSIWDDDRDDAADSMWEAAREALYPSPPKPKKAR